MKIRQIEAFHAFMTFGSVTKAATEMKTSQPMVSRLLSELEREVGFRMFDRKRNHLIATSEAHAFHAKVPRFLTALREINNEAQVIGSRQYGQIVIAAQPIYVDTFLLDVVAEFKQKYPHVRVKILGVGLETLLKTLADHNCNIGIGITLDAGSYYSRKQSLGRCYARCIMPRDHFLAQKSIIDLQDFEGLETVELSLDCPLRTRIDYMMQSKGVERNIVGETRTLTSIFQLVKRRIGIAIVDPFTVLLDTDKQLADIPIAYPLYWDMAVYFRNENPVSDIEQDFIDMVKNKIDALKNDGALNSFTHVLS